MSEKKKSIQYIAAVSAAVSVLSLVVSLFWQAEALGLMLALVLFGALAGWIARRHGWLSGLIVGLPLALFQMTRPVIQEYGSFAAVLAAPDYWRFAVPACVVSVGLAIMGGVSGAWLQDMKLQKGS